MNQAAAAWINSPQDFNEAVELLERIQPSHPLLSIFKTAENSWAKEKIGQILKDLSGSPQEKKVDLRKHQPKPKKQISPQVKTSEIPDEFRDEYQNRIRRLYALIGSVRSEFNPSKPQAHNKAVSDKIQQILDHINGFYERVRDFNEGGELVIHKRGLFHDYKEIELKIKSSKQYISRNKKDPKMSKAIYQREIEIDVLQAELQELEDFLLEYA